MRNIKHKNKRQIKPHNTLQNINRSILNNSTSKRLNTFSKAQRFSEPQVPQHFLIKYKTEPDQPTRQAIFPTIPKAQRAFFFDKQKEKQKYPSPDSYQVKYADQIWQTRHHGQTIGKRDYRNTSRNINPGPSDYSKQQKTNKKSFNRSYTFYRSSRDLTQFLNEKGKDSPGPKYEGNIGILSKRITRGTAIMREEHKANADVKKRLLIAKSGRFDTSKLEKQLVTTKETSQNNTKKVFGPKMKQTARCTFSHKSIEEPRSITPGPANYINFSQFSGWK